MKRFDKHSAGDNRPGARRGPSAGGFSGRRDDFGDDRRQGPRGRSFEPRFEGAPRGRPAYDRPNSQGDRKPYGAERSGPRNTFRRDDGPRGGYGRPSNGGNFARPERESRPESTPAARPVAVADLKKGVREANRALGEVIEQFGHTIEGGYDISELEVTVAFGADGRFLGFGQGGAASMTLSVTPLDGEAMFEAEPSRDMQAANELTVADDFEQNDFDDELDLDDEDELADDEDDQADDEAAAKGEAALRADVAEPGDAAAPAKASKPRKDAKASSKKPKAAKSKANSKSASAKAGAKEATLDA